MRAALPALAAAIAALVGGCASSPELSEQAEPQVVCVVRHAEAFKNLTPVPDGMKAQDLDALTPRGEADASALAVRLPPRLEVVLSSPTRRTRQTAEGLAGAVRVEVSEALRPLAGGPLPAPRGELWRAGEDPRPEGGESLADGQARVVALLDQLRAELPPGGVAVLVTHGPIAATILGELRGAPLLMRHRTDDLATGEMRCLPLR